MARKKSAPQPLSLQDPSSTTAPSTTAAVPNRIHHGSTLSADLDTVSPTSTGLSPADSRSPASAASRTSPFSGRFAGKRPQTARPGQPKSPEFESLDRRRPSQPFIDDKAQKPTTYPHIATSYNSSAAPVRSAYPETKKSKGGGFFHFHKQSKTISQFSSHAHQLSVSSRDEAQSRGSEGPGASRQGESPRPMDPDDNSKPLNLKTSRSELSLSSAGDREPGITSTVTKKGKQKPFGLLTRTKSTRDKEATSPVEAHDPMPALVSQSSAEGDLPPLKTAPVAHDRSFRDMMDSSVRNRSEDRLPTREGPVSRDHYRGRDPRESKGLSASARENGGGSTFLSGLKNSSTRAAGMFGRTLFGKGHRSAGIYDGHMPPDDDHYQLKVLNLPLAVQARKTRISKRLEDSRDKTEFWMPAFPWRAIDYLNYKGCEVEGLYRVPGSGPQIKRWQRRFDEEYDVNLLEEEDLYDINIIGSMLKAWLRELPDELFPKASQERISRECAGSETVPEMLVDELSNLSPFQYYLLFAITCHLSLLLAHSDKNKMDFRNLCICFQPCMKIDAFCFKFLVCNWRECWKGCKNEAAYIEEEYRLLDQPPPQGLTAPREPRRSEKKDKPEEPLEPQSDDRQRITPSPDSASVHSDQSYRSADERPLTPKQAQLQESGSKNTVGSHDSSISTTLSIQSEREHIRTTELRRLSPIKPLSPLGFN